MDYDQAIEIAEGVYWVGFHDKADNFHCNPYLIIDRDEAVLIDPGSVPHFPVVARKVISVIDPKKITHLIASHQDPDIASAIPVFEDLIARPDLKVVSTAKVIYFLKFYGIKAEYYGVEKNEHKLKLTSGRELDFICANYLHTPGVFTTYDQKTKILFTSDLFGSYSADWDLFAKADYQKTMEAFHAVNMPSHRILEAAMNKFEKLDLEMIAPQHGSIIKKEHIGTMIASLKKLECGFDLGLEC